MFTTGQKEYVEEKQYIKDCVLTTLNSFKVRHITG